MVNNNCETCSGTISCEFCKKQFHVVCVSKTVDILDVLNSVPGLLWRCDECVKSCISINNTEVTNLLESTVIDALRSIRAELSSLKSDVSKVAKEPVTIPPTTRNADVVNNKTFPAVIVQPKNKAQEIKQTKSELMHNINPTDNSIHLTKVKHIKDGGILIACKSKEENEKIMKLVQETMSDSYAVKEVAGINPRLCIVGLSEKYTEEMLQYQIRNCNPEIFSKYSDCKIVKIFPTKKNAAIFQAVSQIDRNVYDIILKADNLFVGYDSCRVYDALEVSRCYNCNEFNHSSKSCNNSLSCPLCGGNHNVKSCRSQLRNCTNCVKLSGAQGSTTSCDHAVWDRSVCTAYKIALTKLKKDLLGI